MQRTAPFLLPQMSSKELKDCFLENPKEMIPLLSLRLPSASPTLFHGLARNFKRHFWQSFFKRHFWSLFGPKKEKIYIFSLSLSSFYLVFFFLATLGLRCCAQVFTSCGEQGLLSCSDSGLLIAVAPLVSERRL